VHCGLEGHAPQLNADVGQAEGRVIDHDVAATLGAITAVAQLATFEFPERLLTFRDLYVLRFPQREDTDWRCAITLALAAMTVTHVERLTGRFDFHRPAVTSAFMCLKHEVLFRIWKPGSQEDLAHTVAASLREARARRPQGDGYNS